MAMMDLAGYRSDSFGRHGADQARRGSCYPKIAPLKKVVCATVAVPQLLLALDSGLAALAAGMARSGTSTSVPAWLDLKHATPTRQQPHLPTAVHESCARPVSTIMNP